jgi:hypothetical protein
VWRRLVLKPQPRCHPPRGFPHITKLWPAYSFRGLALVLGGDLLRHSPERIAGIEPAALTLAR